MKLRDHQFSTRPRIFDGGYEHPWYKENGCVRKSDIATPILKKPNPPTQEQIKKAKFVDKTYQWPKKK
tara:strand:+ start:34 stop:237 length:204 start_codon:yes stop_codon:yes gene_type:complete